MELRDISPRWRGGRGDWLSAAPWGEAPAEQEKGGRPRIAHGNPPLSLRDISPRWRGGRGKRTPTTMTAHLKDHPA